jgi:hypothetical protein
MTIQSFLVVLSAIILVWSMIIAGCFDVRLPKFIDDFCNSLPASDFICWMICTVILYLAIHIILITLASIAMISIKSVIFVFGIL